jgi:hypothetical protein
VPQLYDTERKVIYRHSDSTLEVYELWYYTDYVTRPSKTEDGYICGRLDSEGKFLDENTIYQDKIVGYLEDNLDLWHRYLELTDQIKNLK